MIKLFAEDNYSEIISLWERSVEATHHFLSKEDFEFYKNTVPEYFPRVDSLYIYQEDNIIKAFIGISGDEIDMLFADPLYLAKGIGKQLLKYTIDVLKIKKVDVNEQNINALRFYQHFGFKIMSRSETDGFGKKYPILHLEL